MAEKKYLLTVEQERALKELILSKGEFSCIISCQKCVFFNGVTGLSRKRSCSRSYTKFWFGGKGMSRWNRRRVVEYANLLLKQTKETQLIFGVE